MKEFDTGDGLILIDPGYTNTAYLVIDSIYSLGFKPRDIFFDAEENGKVYRVGMFGGAGVNILEKSHPSYDFDGCQEAYLASVERLEKEKVDVFIGNHCWNNGTYEKAEKLLSGGENEFINDKAWGEFLTSCKSRVLQMMKEEAN